MLPQKANIWEICSLTLYSPVIQFTESSNAIVCVTSLPDSTFLRGVLTAVSDFINNQIQPVYQTGEYKTISQSEGAFGVIRLIRPCRGLNALIERASPYVGTEFSLQLVKKVAAVLLNHKTDRRK